jgi:hypothetical protein
VTLATVGLLVRVGPHASLGPLWVLVLSAFAAHAVLTDLHVVSGPRVTSRRQTARGWACAFGPLGAVTAWGVDLGLVVTTRIEHQATLLLLAFALIAPEAGIAAIVLASHGAARAAAVGFAVIRSKEHFSEECDLINRRQSVLRLGTVVATMGAVVLISIAQIGA